MNSCIIKFFIYNSDVGRDSMNKKPAHFVKAPQKKYTFMLIPNHSGKVYRFSILESILKTSLIVLFLLITSLSIGVWHYHGEHSVTQHRLTQERILTAQLSQENKDYLDEIAFLKTQYQEIDQKLASLQQLEHQVLDMVGLEADNHSQKKSDPYANGIADDDHPLVAMVSRSASMRSAGPGSDDYEVDVEHLNELISTQRNKMEQLVGDVEAKLEYLDAQPNAWPAQGRISSPFGERISPTNRRTTEFHHGIDIANTSGTSVVAAGSGIVTYSGYNGGYGRMIIISHGYGYTSVYAHNSRNLVEVGDHVKQGETIARMGQTGRATGPHLHFEVRVNGEPKDPMNYLQ